MGTMRDPVGLQNFNHADTCVWQLVLHGLQILHSQTLLLDKNLSAVSTSQKLCFAYFTRYTVCLIYENALASTKYISLKIV